MTPEEYEEVRRILESFEDRIRELELQVYLLQNP